MGGEPVSEWPAMSEDFPLKYGLVSSDRAMTYFEANTLCKVHGADGLAEIFNQDQQDFIEKNLGHMEMQNENLQEKIHIHSETWENGNLTSVVDVSPCSFSFSWLGAQRFGPSYWEWNQNKDLWKGYTNFLNDEQEFKRSGLSNRMCLQMII